MDTAAFAARLPGCFPGGDPYADTPLDRRFAKVVETVDGMSTEHTLTLLNLAASMLPAGESYLEVGSYRGRSVVGAALGNPERAFTAIENFREFGLDPAESEHMLRVALTDWDVADQVRLLRGDAFRLIGNGLPEPVGVYFYDGAHSRLAQHLGLGLAEPVLADEALVVVDDATWPQVARSTARYVARHPGYRPLFDLRADRPEDPRWCNGVKVFARGPDNAAYVKDVGGDPGAGVWQSLGGAVTSNLTPAVAVRRLAANASSIRRGPLRRRARAGFNCMASRTFSVT